MENSNDLLEIDFNDNTVKATTLSTVQSRYHNSDEEFGGYINIFQQNGNGLLPKWWSRSRDEYLRYFAKQSDYMSSAIYKFYSKIAVIEPRVLPKDPNIYTHRKLAEYYNSLLLYGSEAGMGWSTLLSKMIYDYSTQDNGWFVEVLGAGNPLKPIEGPALGLLSLDAARCRRTGNIEYPVVYQDTDGKYYKLHRSRVAFASSMPSSEADKNGVGFCWTSRVSETVQNLIDMAMYKQEKMGSRPIPRILFGKGISGKQIAQAISQAEASMNNSNLSRYAKTAVLGVMNNPNVELESIDLNNLPDNFDEKVSTEIAINVIAMAGGIPPRDLWPATSVGATIADTEMQNIAGSAGYEIFLDTIVQQFSGVYGKFLPASLDLVFDAVDDSQDERRASINKTRAEKRKFSIEIGITDIHTERQIMLNNGELSEAQFNYLEMSDGRLPNGMEITELFYSENDYVIRYLGGVTLDSDILEIKQQLELLSNSLQNVTNMSTRYNIEPVYYALKWLLKERESVEMSDDTNDEEITKETAFKPPIGAMNNGKKVIEWREKYGDEVRGMTSVGWTRARQLANGDRLSLDVVKRMAQFNRHRSNFEVALKKYNAEYQKYKDLPLAERPLKAKKWYYAGIVAWLGWGGNEGIDWAIRVSRDN